MYSTHSRGPTDQPDSLSDSARPAAASYLIDWRTSLRLAERACCCPAKPAIVAIVPPSSGRSAPSELLLCRHHYVASERALVDGAAAIFDRDGEPLTALTRALVQAGATVTAATMPVAEAGR